MKEHLPFKDVINRTNYLVMITKAEPIDAPEGPEIIFVNQAVLDLTGYTMKEIIGKTPRILQGPKTDTNELKKIKQALIQEKIISASLLNYKKNGTEFWVDFTITPIYDSHGKLKFFSSVEYNVSKYKHSQEELYHLACTDPLTGIFNRRRFMESLYEQFLRMQREKIFPGLLIIDIDHFKSINDTLGHLKGDEILCIVANIAQSICRATDYICRYGGDEFFLLLNNVKNKVLLKKAKLIQKEIMKNTQQNVSVCIGGSIMESSDKSIQDLIKRADNALYQAKKKGINNNHII